MKVRMVHLNLNFPWTMCLFSETWFTVCHTFVTDICLLEIATWPRLSTDLYITDKKSGIRADVKAGSGSKVFPLVVESRTRRHCKTVQKSVSLFKEMFEGEKLLDWNSAAVSRGRVIYLWKLVMLTFDCHHCFLSAYVLYVFSMGLSRYVQDGSSLMVVGIFHRNEDMIMIVQPSQVVSIYGEGCFFQLILMD